MKLAIPLLLLVFAFAGCKSSILDDPSTTISYKVTEREHVRITIENSYKTTVALLVDDIQLPGAYSIQTNDMKLPEGLYFWTMETRGIESGNYSKKTLYTVVVK
ncbi:MAG: hypothetical protein HF314_15075 [Ignavibacteria bacterium]|jgi:hypothetical protein|nr:hypothetical protein [Ignavibacteria bacterium]MCU7504403.1 hypothetical protein [Ignavibacteria bacterium]MCU7518156.1 hypothetical protein [Ignavibacteria bacterium]